MLNSASPRRPLAVDARLPLARTLLRLGVRQVAVLRATSASIAMAPTIDDCAGCIERARDALLQLERAAELYLEHTSASLLADAERLLGELPVLGSWIEAALAQLLLCLATQVELERAGETRALASATEHVNAARAALHEAGALHRDLAQPHSLSANAARWLTVALGTLEDDGARADYQRALERVVSAGFLDLAH